MCEDTIDMYTGWHNKQCIGIWPHRLAHRCWEHRISPCTGESRLNFMHTCEYASLFLSCEPVPETKKRKICRRTSSGKRETGTNEFLCSLRESTLYQRCASLRRTSTRSMSRSPDPAKFSPSKVSLTALQVTACSKRLRLRCNKYRSCLPQERFLTVTGA